MSTDDLEGRLGRLGQVPIAPDVEATHRHSIAQAVSGPTRARFGWKAVALASLAGFFAGSTALAAAGSLPAPAQDVAHDTLGAVGISVPRSTEGCPDGTSYRNHGEYVSAVDASGGDVRAAAHSDCGKPVHSSKGNGNDKEDGVAPGAGPDRDGDPCTGPPPWAGAHLDTEAKDVARAEREATCGPDDADEPDDAEVEPDDAEEEDPASKRGATTTTVPVETTTTTVAETTTTTQP
ncbi:MAG: hypothetical protein ABIP36_01965 [Acidimicrobiales bacterium]